MRSSYLCKKNYWVFIAKNPSKDEIFRFSDIV